MALPRRLSGPKGHRGGPEGTLGWPAPSRSTGTPLFWPLPSGPGSAVGQGLGGSAGGGGHQGPPPTSVPPNTGGHGPPKNPTAVGEPANPPPAALPMGVLGSPPGAPLPPASAREPCWPFHQYFLMSWA